MMSRKLEKISAATFTSLSASEQTASCAGLGITPTVGLTKQPTLSQGVVDQAPDYVRDA
jgi:hypothetical protein